MLISAHLVYMFVLLFCSCYCRYQSKPGIHELYIYQGSPVVVISTCHEQDLTRQNKMVIRSQFCCFHAFIASQVKEVPASAHVKPGTDEVVARHALPREGRGNEMVRPGDAGGAYYSSRRGQASS